MRLTTIIFFTSLISTTLAFSQNNTTTNNDKNAPIITFENVEHDYGTIYKGDDGKCEFRFTNTGKEPLILSNPRSSCGCTVPIWSREPILPGKSGLITIIYDTKRTGPFNKTITVLSNAKNKTVVLRIKGFVKPKIEE